MIETLFPDGVFVEIANLSAEVPSLFPAEEAAVSRSVSARKTEFARGRGCARAALKRLGVEPRPLPVKKDRAPGWPAGTVGSITHCENFVGAAVALESEMAGLGFDAEPALPLDSDLIPMVCTARELDECSADESDIPLVAKIVFGAKEAIFKSVFPYSGVWLEFGDVDIEFESGMTSFRVSWTGFQVPGALPDPARISGRLCKTPEHFFAGVVLALP